MPLSDEELVIIKLAGEVYVSDAFGLDKIVPDLLRAGLVTYNNRYDYYYDFVTLIDIHQESSKTVVRGDRFIVMRYPNTRLGLCIDQAIEEELDNDYN